MPNVAADDLDLTPNSTGKAVLSASDVEVDFGNTDILTKEGLSRIKVDDKNVARLALLTDIVKPRVAWSHFILKDGQKRQYKCLTVRDGKNRVVGEEAICCKRLNHDKDFRAQLNFAVLAFRYLNADPQTGGYKAGPDGQIPAINWELGWLKLSRTGFGAVAGLIYEGEKASDFDLTINKKPDNGIGYEYKRKSKGLPLFYSNETLLAEVRAEAAKYANGEALLRYVTGNVVSEIDMKALVAGHSANASAQAGTNNIHNTDDL